MKIGLISDVHANLFALEAVLAHAGSMGVKQFWCLGDYVHFNAFPDEVVKTIRKLDAISIYGNIDLAVLNARKLVYKKNASDIPEEEKPILWTYQQLTRKNRNFLNDLPMKKRIKIKGNRFLLIHGSPAGYDDPLFVDTPEDRLRELAKLTNAEFVLVGHTHRPFVREVEGTTFINPGSVGKPFDGDPRACYAILKVKEDQVSVQQYRVEYNLEKMIRAMKDADLPENYIQAMELSVGNQDLPSQPAEETALA